GPWFVSMRMIGTRMGAPRIWAMRRSVMRRSEGLELRLTCCAAWAICSSRDARIIAASERPPRLADLSRPRRVNETPSRERCGVLRVVVLLIAGGLPDSGGSSAVSGAGYVRDGG